MRTIGTGNGGSGDGELNSPSDVTVLPVSGQIAIAESSNHRVSVFDGESGNFVRAIGSQKESQDGQFMQPCAIAADAYERLGSEPLTEVAENLTRYQRGRRYLRASVLAVLLGIADVKPNDPAATAEVPGAAAETATQSAAVVATGPSAMTMAQNI